MQFPRVIGAPDLARLRGCAVCIYGQEKAAMEESAMVDRGVV
jgi:hypothetical protein